MGAPIISTNLPPFWTSVSEKVISGVATPRSFSEVWRLKSNPFDVSVIFPPPLSTAVIPKAAVFILSSNNSITSSLVFTTFPGVAVKTELSSPTATV